MRKIALLILSLLLLVKWNNASDEVPKKTKKMVCFYSGLGKGLNGAGSEVFTARDVDPSLCTHLVYPDADLDDNDNLVAFDTHLQKGKGSYMKFSYLKTFNSNLQTMLMLGRGHSQKLSAIAADKERRANFAQSVLTFLRANWFNGVNLDWQHPGFNKQGSSADKTNYVLLVQTLREEFEKESNISGKPSLLLSIDAPHSIKTLDEGFDLRSLSKYLDFINVFTFNYRFPVEAELSVRAPLYPTGDLPKHNFQAQLNIDFTIKHFLEMGVKRDKIVLGIPTFGRTTVLYEPNQIFSRSQEEHVDLEEMVPKSEGSLPYYEICKMLKSKGWKVESSSPTSAGPYAQKGNFLVSYDDQESVKLKAQYVIQEDLGGLMFWAIDFEDFNGDCFGKRFPLIEAGKAGLTTILLPESSNKIYTDKVKAKVSSFAPKPQQDRKTQESASSKLRERRISLRMADQYDFLDFDKMFPRSSEDQLSKNAPQGHLVTQGHSFTPEDQLILQQLVSLVKKLGGVAVLERLLSEPEQSSDRSSPGNNLRAFPPDLYGSEVASLTVTSPPLTLRRAPLPIVLSNFTVNIEELRIDASSFSNP